MCDVFYRFFTTASFLQIYLRSIIAPSPSVLERRKVCERNKREKRNFFVRS